MLFNKILGKIIKIFILENFSKFVVKFVPICSKNYRLYHKSVVKATDYITPVHSSAYFLMGTWA